MPLSSADRFWAGQWAKWEDEPGSRRKRSQIVESLLLEISRLEGENERLRREHDRLHGQCVYLEGLIAGKDVQVSGLERDNKRHTELLYRLEEAEAEAREHARVRDWLQREYDRLHSKGHIP